jgi:aspartyl-tRNA(Asn)/glutamyl-tRNA(Gln) amidotransferase subunit C
MSLTIAEVRKIAKLARVNLTPDEEARHAETISVVLDYMKMLNELDTSGIEPTAQVTGLEDVVRDDVARDSKIKKQILEQIPEIKNNLLAVPAVFENYKEE